MLSKLPFFSHKQQALFAINKTLASFCFIFKYSLKFSVPCPFMIWLIVAPHNVLSCLSNYYSFKTTFSVVLVPSSAPTCQVTTYFPVVSFDFNVWWVLNSPNLFFFVHLKCFSSFWLQQQFLCSSYATRNFLIYHMLCPQYSQLVPQVYLWPVFSAI